MTIRILKFIFLLTTLLLAGRIYGIKATPEPVKVLQPDGSEITILLKGDEFFNYRTTIDGYIIAKNTDGIYHYANFGSGGEKILTNIRANEINQRKPDEVQFLKKLTPFPDASQFNISSRIQRAAEATESSDATNGFPLTGSPRSLVILVNFADKSYVVNNPKAAYTNLLNQEGYSDNGGTGSARDYFRDASNGVFAPQFDVVGPYTLPRNMEFYGGNVSDNDKNPRQMVIDACKLADDAGLDFKIYDTDNNGVIDNVFIYYAGYNEAEGGGDNTVWPHRWSMASGSNHSFDGVKVWDYACTSELRGRTGANMCGIGTFAHEFGHVLGLSDYYATNGASHHTLYNWNIMDNGAYLNQGRTPPTYSAYDRFFLGWLRPVELKDPQNVKLESLADSNQAYIITQYGNHNLNGRNPSPVEFFTLENRQKKGWDTFLPNSGLLITRIYYNASTWNYNSVNNSSTTMGVDIMEADKMATTSSATGDVFPGTGNVTSYNPVLRSGVDIGKPLTNIKHDDGIITFKFRGGDAPNLAAKNTLSVFSTVHGTPSEPQSILVSGTLLVDKVSMTFFINNHFEFKLKTEESDNWVKNLNLNIDGSILPETEILVRYNPSEPSFKATHSDNLTIESTDAEKVTISLSGTSTRQIYVVPPLATNASEVTMSSFQANWNPVYDASGYYLTLFNVTDGGITELNEGFDTGLRAPEDWTIIASDITNSTAYSGIAIPGLQLKNTGDGVITCEYIMPPVVISAYLKTLAGSNGIIRLEGWNGQQWIKIDSVAVTNTLAEFKKFNLNPAENMIRFRFTYIKGEGFAVIDDVSATFPYNLEINYQNKWVADSYDVQNDLLPERKYFYKVKASDKTLYEDNTLKYENKTAYSNIIEVNTLKDIDGKKLLATPMSDGTVRVVVPRTGDPVNVFNVLGQKIMSLNANSNVLTIPGLARNQMYIIISGERKAKIAL